MVQYKAPTSTSNKDLIDQLEENLKAYKHLSEESYNVTEALSVKLNELTRATSQIYIRATKLTTAQTNIAACKQQTEQLYECLQTTRKLQRRLEQGPGKDFDEFLAALTQLEEAQNFLSRLQNLQSARKALLQASTTFDTAIAHCEDDFTTVLTEQSNKNVPSISMLVDKLDERARDPSKACVPLIPPSDTPRLAHLARTIMRCGNLEMMVDRYVRTRQGVAEAVMKSCGHEAVSLASLQTLTVEQLEKKIQIWILQVRVLGVLVVSERALAQEVWPSSHSYLIFSQIVGRPLSLLFQQGRDLANARPQPDKLYALLDMHMYLQEVAPLLEAGLRGPAGSGVDDMAMQVGQLLQFIATVARNIFGEFEEQVAKEQGGKKEALLPADGTVHSLCAYTLSFLKKLFGHENVSDVLFSKPGVVPTTPIPHLPAHAPAAQHIMAAALARIMTRLLDHLTIKAKAYKNDALANLFLMNNIHYMAWTVEQYRPALDLLGFEWVERHKDLVENYGAEYQRSTWDPLLQLLQVPDENSSPSKQSASVKDRLLVFNKNLEQVWSTQAAWTVPDPTLRRAVQRVIVQDVVPHYEVAYSRFSEMLQMHAKEPGKYLKFTPGDLQHVIEDLFETKQVSARKRGAREEQ